ncbi:MAG: nuclear transport factor 2 family protein [Micrococcales bacterium]
MAYPKTKFDDYIRRFNARDLTAFEDYLHPQMHMQNGMLEFDGVEGMKHHYRDLIWPDFSEELFVTNFMSDNDQIAIKMYTLFTAFHDKVDSLFGPVRKGETFEFDGLIMYKVEDDLFKNILVAYNSFIYTDLQGNKKDLGVPH